MFILFYIKNVSTDLPHTVKVNGVQNISDPTDFHTMDKKKKTVRQYIFLCVQQKKRNAKCLEQHEGKLS